MKKLLKNQKLVVFFLLLLAMMVGTAVVLAQPYQLMDHFDSGAQDIIATAPGTNNGFVSSLNSLGGERDIFVTAGGSIGRTTEVIIDPLFDSLYVSQAPGAAGSVQVVWDGPDNDATTIDYTGLGAVDMNADGISGINLGVFFDDLPAAVTIRIYTSSTNFSVFTQNLPGGIYSEVNYFIPFSSFTPAGSNGGADFRNVGAVEMVINGTITPGADIEIHFIEATTFDFGDLPSSYINTLLINNGARHTISDLQLGPVSVPTDGELNGQESSTATGDNLNGLAPDDENGVVFVTSDSWGDGSGTLNVEVNGSTRTGGACLLGWIDWNANNSFADSPFGVAEVVVNAFVSTDGAQNYTITTPTLADYGGVSYPATLNSRFRIFEPYAAIFSGLTLDGNGCPTGTTAQLNVLTTGDAIGGEVEDYQTGFNPTAVSLQSFTPAANSTLPVIGFVGFLALAIVSLGTFIVRREQKKA